MTVLVLGGTGFLGREVRAALAAAGRPAVSVARRGEPGTVPLDLAAGEPAELADLLVDHRVTGMVNAAGSVWDDDPDELRRANVDLVDTLCRAAAAVPWPVRLVQLGTVFEYRLPPPGEALSEATPCEPTSAYGRTKLRASELVLTATRAGQVDGVVLRVTTGVGPGMPRASLLGRVAGELGDALAANRPAELRLAPLTARRDVVDSRDVAAAVLAALTAPVTGAVLNIGRGIAVPVRDLVRMLVDHSGVPATIHEREPATGRSAGIPWLATSNRAAARRLAWRPRYEPAATIAAIWAAVRRRTEPDPASGGCDATDGHP